MGWGWVWRERLQTGNIINLLLFSSFFRPSQSHPIAVPRLKPYPVGGRDGKSIADYRVSLGDRQFSALDRSKQTTARQGLRAVAETLLFSSRCKFSLARVMVISDGAYSLR